jgi:hypothetical protein
MTSTTAPTTYRALKSGDQITGYSIRTKNGTTFAGEFWTTVGEGKLARFMGGCDRSSFYHVELWVEGDDAVVLTTAGEIFALDGYR